MKLNNIFFALLFFCSGESIAQQFGGHRPSVRWQQVNTPEARVIFPQGLDSTAARIAAIAQRLNSMTLPTIGGRNHKINIVLQPYTTVSNGYVGLGPFRSEFYLTPSQNSFELGSLPWHDMLAIHEYRHVQQYNNFNVGLARVARLIFGQYGQELANAATIPNWFYEGDAVFQETLVSPQGRGRLPWFYNDYRSLWLAGKKYSWMKLRNGSYRDFTPDHYRLGYMMVAYGREKYGEDFWRKVTHDAAAFNGLFYPFQRAIKKYAGVPYSRFREDAFNYFKRELALMGANKGESFEAGADSMALAQISSYSRQFVSQQFPAYTENGTLVYLKSSYKQIPAFTEQGSAGERRIRVRDVSLDDQFSYRNGKIVYASFRPDIRWRWNDYSEVQVLDMATGRQKTITRRSKYFSPDISADGRTIVAAQSKPGEISHLHLLDAANGALLKELPNPARLFYTYPRFVNDKQVVTAVRDTSGRMAIVLVNTGDGHTDWLTPASYRVLGFPVVQHDTIYFTAAGDKADGLYAVVLGDKKLYALTLPPPAAGVGVYQPALSSDSIRYSSFTAVGFRLQQVAKKDAAWQELATGAWTQVDHSFGVHLQQNSAAGLLAGVPPVAAAPVSRYPKTYQLFNFHSLLPYASDPDYQLSIVGENILNTLQSELYVAYNRDEGYKQGGAAFTYGGWFPYINAGASYIVNRSSVDTASRPIYWNESQANIGLSVPLNLSKGRSTTTLTAGADYVYKNVTAATYSDAWFKGSLPTISFAYLNSYVSFTHQIQAARQHIFPRLAQTLYFNYRRAIQTVDANQALVSGSLYLPGLFLTNNIVINVAYQWRDTLNRYRFTNSFPFSRGYTVPNLRNMFKWGVNYHFPLLYADAGIANIVYFQRVRGNVFYDQTRGNVAYSNGQRIDTDFRSYGSEIFFDTKWWNNVPVSFGFRYSRLIDRDLFGGRAPDQFEFILPVNLFQR